MELAKADRKVYLGSQDVPVCDPGPQHLRNADKQSTGSWEGVIFSLGDVTHGKFAQNWGRNAFPPSGCSIGYYGYLVVMLFVFLAQLCWILKQGPQIKHGIDFKIGNDCI